MTILIYMDIYPIFTGGVVTILTGLVYAEYVEI